MPRHRAQAEEEDAASLKLGSEFVQAGCLLISEVKYLLEHKERDNTDNAVYNKTLDYVRTFSRYTSADSASSVRSVLASRDAGLSQFEIAQLANLCPADVDEARSLIPSLVKVDDDRLQAMIDEMLTLRKFQS